MKERLLTKIEQYTQFNPDMLLEHLRCNPTEFYWELAKIGVNPQDTDLIEELCNQARMQHLVNVNKVI